MSPDRNEHVSPKQQHHIVLVVATVDVVHPLSPDHTRHATTYDWRSLFPLRLCTISRLWSNSNTVTTPLTDKHPNDRNHNQDDSTIINTRGSIFIHEDGDHVAGYCCW